jgi:GNAT superfamily N-acetyltransferase
VDAVVELVQAAYRGEGGPGRWTTEAHLVKGHRTSAAEVASHVAAPSSAILVTEDGEGLLACCHLKSLAGQSGGRAYFGLFAVRPGHQGAGVGRAMVGQSEAWVRSQWAASVMEMQVIDDRKELLSWYARLGYRRTGRYVPFPYDDPDDRPLVPGLRFVVLEKRLDPGEAFSP